MRLPGVRGRRAAEASEHEPEEGTEPVHHEHPHTEPHEHHSEHHPSHHDYNNMKEKFMNELGHLPSKTAFLAPFTYLYYCHFLKTLLYISQVEIIFFRRHPTAAEFLLVRNIMMKHVYTKHSPLGACYQFMVLLTMCVSAQQSFPKEKQSSRNVILCEKQLHTFYDSI